MQLKKGRVQMSVEVLSFVGRASTIFRGMRELTEGNFYFIEDQYFIDFPDPSLMKVD